MEGANIRNILDFEKEFKDAKVISLSKTTVQQTILDAANYVIKNNLGRKNKSLWTDKKAATKLSILSVPTSMRKLLVANEIKRLNSEKNRPYKDFAVLYRVNAMSRVIEEMFMREGISYKIFGGLKFYDRKEIKDVLAYLRVIQNPGDNISLKRIINEPKRGIGNVTVDTAEQLANKRGVSIFTIISSAQDIPELSRAWAKLEKFVSLINSLRVQSQIMTASEMIGEVIERTGILSGYEQENTVEAQTRIENIKELISVAMEFENENEEKESYGFSSSCIFGFGCGYHG